MVSNINIFFFFIHEYNTYANTLIFNYDCFIGFVLALANDSHFAAGFAGVGTNFLLMCACGNKI